MNIPESITRCAVEGDLLKVVLDSRDPGSVPNAKQLRDLKATVTATVPYLSPPEGMFVMPPFVFETNQVGQIINPESPDDAPLIPATNQVHTPEFRYLVEVTSLDLAEPIRWRAAAPAGGVLNLSEVVDPPAPEDIPAWEQTLVEVGAARAEVVAAVPVAVQAAADAMTFRDQAGAIAAGDIIDDVTPSVVTVFSSQETLIRVDESVNELAGMKADIGHTHTAEQVTSGTFSSLRLPSASVGARGAVQLALESEAVTGTDTQRAVTPAGLTAAFDARPPIGLRAPDAPGTVGAFIGDSTMISGRWAGMLTTMLGWAGKNYAVSGHGFATTGTGSFPNQATQLIAEADSTGVDPHFIIVSGGQNDARPDNSVITQATDVFSRLRARFPGARIVAVPGVWNAGIVTPQIIRVSQEVRDAALDNQCEVIWHAFEWMYGHPEWMADAVHPNADGYWQIARRVRAGLFGSDTDVKAIAPIALNAANVTGDSRNFVRAENGRVSLHLDVNAVAGVTIVNGLPVGTIPAWARPGTARGFPLSFKNTDAWDSSAMAYVNASGSVSLWGLIGKSFQTAGQMFASTSWPLGT